MTATPAARYRVVLLDDHDGLPHLVGSVGEMIRLFVPLSEALLLPDGWTRPRLEGLSGERFREVAKETGQRGYASVGKIALDHFVFNPWMSVLARGSGAACVPKPVDGAGVDAVFDPS